MIWPAWIAVALFAVVATWRRDPRPALLILAGLIAMRLSVVIPVPWRMIAEAGLWIGIGGVIVARFHANLCGALVVASGLCYIWARVGGYPIAPGSPPFVASDALGFLALIVAARGHHVGGRGRFLDRRRRGWGNRFARGVAHMEEGAQ